MQDYHPAGAVGNAAAATAENGRAVVQAAALEWGKKQRQTVADSDAEMTEKLKAEGMEFNEVDRPAFVAAVAPIWESEAATFGPDLMALMDAARK